MTHLQVVANLKKRIARAGADATIWRIAGSGEKYLEAYSRMEAMELELAALEDAAGRSARLEAAHRAALAVEPSAANVASNQAQLMADLAIAYDGVRYYYDTYRYDKLEDAIAYAKLRRSREGSVDVSMPLPATIHSPDDADRRVMNQWGITHLSGEYRLGEFRYERLLDALNYARLMRPKRPK